MKNTITILTCLTMMCLPALAQREMSNWCMGAGANLCFKQGGAMAGALTPMRTLEGCSSISDKITGRLLFFKEGVTVWDSSFSVMPNGTGLKGDISSTQSALIVPMPCNPNKFYIFTTYAQGGYLSGNHSGFNYSIVDMTKHSGNGDVVIKNQQMYEPSTEKLCGTFASDNNSIWLLSHRFNTSDFVIYKISTAGISKGNTINIGAIHQDPSFAPYTGLGAIGTMIFSNDGHYIAVANSFNRSLELFLFDKSGGNIIKEIAVDTIFTATNGPYGLAFSPDNSKLYATTIKGDVLYQYDLHDPIFASSRTVVAEDSFDVLGQAQLAPDGKIYFARENKSSLAVINYPNRTPGIKVGFVRNGINLGSGTSILGLPNFISNYAAPIITQKVYYKNCDKLDSLSYTVLPIHAKGNYLWHFSDPFSGKNDSSINAQPLHLFSAAGYHKISLKLTGCNYMDTFSRTVDVSPHPYHLATKSDNSNIPNQAVSICPGGHVILVAEGAPVGFQYQWLINHIRICTCDSVYLTPLASEMAVIQSGMNTPCFTADTVNLIVYEKPVVNTIQNAEVCKGFSTSLWVNGGVQYQWYPSTYLDKPTSSTPVFSGTVTTNYNIVVTDSNGCKDTSNLSVEVYNTVFAEAGTDVLTDEMGKVELHGNSNGIVYTWSPNVGIDNIHSLSPTVVVDQTTQYILTAIDAHGCKAIDSVWVHVNRTPSLFVTSAFTPNNDGINDEFKIFTHNITEIHLKIFNRYGNLLYESETLPARWDGKYNGVLQPEGTYFYDINARTFEGGVLIKHGDVALLH